MSGLLHRLAEAAIGTGRPVRSNARLPFNDAALAWTDGMEVAPARIGPARQLVPEAVPVSQAAATPPTADAPSPLLPRSEQAAAAPSQAGERTVAAATRATSVSAKAELTLDAELPKPLLPVRPPPTPVNAPGRTPVRTPQQVLDEQPIPDDLATGPERVAEAASVPDRIRTEPSPLLPRAATPAAPRPLQPERPRAPDPGGSDHDAEVHIHIGRIEVTAVQAPPPPRRKSAPRPAPVSLDEYLTRRGRT